MASTSKLNPDLHDLGIERLEDTSIQDLESRFKGIYKTEGSNLDVLLIYLEWLNHRLQVIDTSDNPSFRSEVSAWCNSLHGYGFDVDFVLESLRDWKQKQLVLEPLNARRFNLAELEIVDVFPRDSLPEKELAAVAISETSHMEPSMLQSSACGETIGTESDVFGKMHPDRIPVIDLDKWEPFVIDLSSDSSNSPSEEENSRLLRREKLPSFLTGANSAVLSDAHKDIRRKGVTQERKKNKEGRKASEKLSTGASYQDSGVLNRHESDGRHGVSSDPARVKREAVCPKANSARDDLTGRQPPPDYVCNRCGVTG
jgi:hypothetical protein